MIEHLEISTSEPILELPAAKFDFNANKNTKCNCN